MEQYLCKLAIEESHLRLWGGMAGGRSRDPARYQGVLGVYYQETPDLNGSAPRRSNFP